MKNSSLEQRGSQLSSAEVQTMFNQVSPRYVLANHILSLGMDWYWRWKTTNLIKTFKVRKILDVATGTGDLALSLQKKMPKVEIIGLDLSKEMLEIAGKKGLSTYQGDALTMPFHDNQFDIVTVAFGLRNMKDWQKAIIEMKRVLRQGGKLLILDFSLPRCIWWKYLYLFYLDFILPCIGGFISGRKSAYEYLSSSIKTFPSGKKMLTFLQDCGFNEVKQMPMSGEIASLYCAEKR